MFLLNFHSWIHFSGTLSNAFCVETYYDLQTCMSRTKIMKFVLSLKEHYGRFPSQLFSYFKLMIMDLVKSLSKANENEVIWDSLFLVRWELFKLFISVEFWWAGSFELNLKFKVNPFMEKAAQNFSEKLGLGWIFEMCIY